MPPFVMWPCESLQVPDSQELVFFPVRNAESAIEGVLSNRPRIAGVRLVGVTPSRPDRPARSSSIVRFAYALFRIEIKLFALADATFMNFRPSCA